MDINDEILISYLLNEVSPEQAKVIEELQIKNNGFKNRLEQYQIILDTSKNLMFESEIDPVASLKALKQKAARNAIISERIKAKSIAKFLQFAAGLLFVISFSWYYYANYRVREIQFITHNEVKRDTLSDGSVVTLNKSTVLKYPQKFSKSQRKVNLSDGEAFFTVTHDAKIPFIIYTGGLTIADVGTSFNVKSHLGEVEIIVETGSVKVSRNGKSLFLKPGEKMSFNRNDIYLKKENNPDLLYTYYRNNEFVANNTPLRRLVNVLNEAYGTNIIIEKKELGALQLHTTFKNESLETILEIISRTFNITVEKKNGNILIK
jgi:transmembrane sensor